MAYKLIVAIASGQDSDAHVFNAAARLASQHAAHARVLPAYPDPAADLVAYGAALEGVSEAVIERVRDGERTQQQKLESRLAEAATRAGVLYGSKLDGASIEAQTRALMPSVAIAEAAVLADLLMFSGDAARGPLSGLFAESLLEARAPVLIVNDDQFSVGAIAVAWDGSPQAGRAVRAALPLLQAAASVLILRNVDDQTAEADASGDAGRLKGYLASHGVTQTESSEIRGQRVAESLLAAAREAQCEILVAGAYGRPRLFEMVLGGTTRALAHADGGPNILLAH